jgi:tRNA-dihydrouridine synthase 3
LGGHVRKDDAGQLALLVDEEKKAQASITSKELNFIGPDVLKLLRSKKVCWTRYRYPSCLFQIKSILDL